MNLTNQRSNFHRISFILNVTKNVIKSFLQGFRLMNWNSIEFMNEWFFEVRCLKTSKERFI